MLLVLYKPAWQEMLLWARTQLKAHFKSSNQIYKHALENYKVTSHFKTFGNLIKGHITILTSKITTVFGSL